MVDKKEFPEAAKVAQDFTADLATLRDDIAKLTGTVSQLLRSRAAGAGGRVYNSYAETVDHLGDRAAEARDQLGSIGHDVEARIERNPLSAILVAALAGLLLGLFSRAL
ncbi:MAG: hypothetical protein P4L76_12220 [Beijerinckiaceae bacterium]|nr:hypothetical protein [Beijerinckiaceae bacterium]